MAVGLGVFLAVGVGLGVSVGVDVGVGVGVKVGVGDWAGTGVGVGVAAGVGAAVGRCWTSAAGVAVPGWRIEHPARRVHRHRRSKLRGRYLVPMFFLYANGGPVRKMGIMRPVRWPQSRFSPQRLRRVAPEPGRVRTQAVVGGSGYARWRLPLTDVWLKVGLVQAGYPVREGVHIYCTQRRCTLAGQTHARNPAFHTGFAWYVASPRAGRIVSVDRHSKRHLLLRRRR